VSIRGYPKYALAAASDEYLNIEKRTANHPGVDAVWCRRDQSQHSAEPRPRLRRVVHAIRSAVPQEPYSRTQEVSCSGWYEQRAPVRMERSR
jgi:hypothetical protein